MVLWGTLAAIGRQQEVHVLGIGGGRVCVLCYYGTGAQWRGRGLVRYSSRDTDVVVVAALEREGRYVGRPGGSPASASDFISCDGRSTGRSGARYRRHSRWFLPLSPSHSIVAAACSPSNSKDGMSRSSSAKTDLPPGQAPPQRRLFINRTQHTGAPFHNMTSINFLVGPGEAQPLRECGAGRADGSGEVQ